MCRRYADIGIDVVSPGVFVNPHRQNQRCKNRHHSIADPACEVEETAVEGSAIHASPRELMYASVFGLCQKGCGLFARVENAHQSARSLAAPSPQKLGHFEQRKTFGAQTDHRYKDGEEHSSYREMSRDGQEKQQRQTTDRKKAAL
jgi:hypothetical protein